MTRAVPVKLNAPATTATAYSSSHVVTTAENTAPDRASGTLSIGFARASPAPRPRESLDGCASSRALPLTQWSHQLRKGRWLTWCKSTSRCETVGGTCVARASRRAPPSSSATGFGNSSVCRPAACDRNVWRFNQLRRRTDWTECACLLKWAVQPVHALFQNQISTDCASRNALSTLCPSW